MKDPMKLTPPGAKMLRRLRDGEPIPGRGSAKTYEALNRRGFVEFSSEKRRLVVTESGLVALNEFLQRVMTSSRHVDCDCSGCLPHTY